MLSKGDYFGEISCITGMMNTANVLATFDDREGINYIILANLPAEVIRRLEETAPSIFLGFKKRMTQYVDYDFLRRFESVSNVPYFRPLPIETIQEIVFLMRSTVFNQGSTIIKRGDLNDKIHIITEGIVEVVVPYGDQMIHFDYLPLGSCFNVYSAFGEEN